MNELTENLFEAEEIIDKVPTYSSKKLCSMVVCDRYLGINDKIAVACMEELAKRRESGDIFDFESFIEQEFDKLPKLDFSIPDLRTVLGNLVPGAKK